jgi:hypothetical protein
MNDKRTIRFIVIFVFLMIALMIGDLWLRHDLSTFFMHLAILLCIALPIGLFIKFCQNWKYFRIVFDILQLLCFGYLSIEQWHHGSHKLSILSATVCIFALISLIEEIVKLSCKAGIKK